ncbi:hypothetical protein EWM64_g1690 [Hericium alpestre]|uniref:Cytochrome P450 n=1 Tax=Hericium alpestre TaxID=135208 RepID=A0A4Z0A9U9_9AGAM|nr:hypothetical protein EWM64_g1690 [Hericium alpestre]
MIAISPETVAYGALFVAGVMLVKRLLTSRRRLPLPPGPKGWPIIGNIFDMPQEAAGGLIYLNLFGQPAIVVNDASIAAAMLDKKSVMYADRPALVVGGEVAGFNQGVGLMHYGDRFRESRRMMHRHMGSRSSMEKFYGAEELETHRLLRRILERQGPDGKNVPRHIRLTAGAVILMISHGYAVKEKDDYFVHLAEETLSNFAEAITPGRFLADTFPMLRYVPDWFPGTEWKQAAKVWRDMLYKGVDLPHEYVKQQMQAENAVPSFTSMYLEQGKLSEEKEVVLKWTASSIMGGGADTTVCASYTFFLTMLLHPEVQKKAQQELDAVIGPDRLPTIKGRSQLPYIDAIVKEVFRWNPVGPLGIPHSAGEDDVHDGYLIPKGSIIIPNIWRTLHDKQTYKKPFEFKPERFLASEKQQPETDPRELLFGFGRRVCPGQLLADSGLFITCAMVLSVFNIEKVIENGVQITPKPEFVDEVVNHPKLFKCSVKPRSEQAVSIIKSVDFVGD